MAEATSTNVTHNTATIGCAGCDGVARYRVQFAGFRAEGDNFDQLVDHLPLVFTSDAFLRSVAENREGRVTVTRLPTAEDPAGAEPVVIAYAGPHPATSTGRGWNRDLDRVPTAPPAVPMFSAFAGPDVVCIAAHPSFAQVLANALEAIDLAPGSPQIGIYSAHVATLRAAVGQAMTFDLTDMVPVPHAGGDRP